jgi:MFS family permease
MPRERSRTDVRLLAVSQAISMAGTEAAYVGLVTTILLRTGSSAWIAAVLVAWLGVGALAAPFAGALGDRVDRRRLMIASDLLGAAVFVGIAVAREPQVLVVLTALAAVASAPFEPASAAGIPNLVGAGELVWANSRVSAGRTVGGLVGPVLGGFLVSSLGTPAAFLLDAASFVASAILVWAIRGPLAARAPSHVGSESHDLRAGFRFVAADPFLRRLLVAWSIFVFGVGAMIVSELPLARSFGVGSVGYGVLVAAWSGGALAGAVAVVHVVRRVTPIQAIVLPAFAVALGFGVVGLAPWFALAVAAMATAGLANTISETAEQALVQARTPDAIRSRVFAAIEAVVVGSLALGFPLGAAAVGPLGPSGVYLAAGAIGLAATSIMLPLLRSSNELRLTGAG